MARLVQARGSELVIDPGCDNVEELVEIVFANTDARTLRLVSPDPDDPELRRFQTRGDFLDWAGMALLTITRDSWARADA